MGTLDDDRDQPSYDTVAISIAAELAATHAHRFIPAKDTTELSAELLNGTDEALSVVKRERYKVWEASEALRNEMRLILIKKDLTGV